MPKRPQENNQIPPASSATRGKRTPEATRELQQKVSTTHHGASSEPLKYYSSRPHPDKCFLTFASTSVTRGELGLSGGKGGTAACLSLSPWPTFCPLYPICLQQCYQRRAPLHRYVLWQLAISNSLLIKSEMRLERRDTPRKSAEDPKGSLGDAK